MTRILLAMILVFVALAPSVDAQTPEVEHDQPSISGDGISYIDQSGSELAVVAYGVEKVSGAVPFVVHNGTSDVVSNLSVKVEIRDTSGQLRAVDSLDSSVGWAFFQPQTLMPGDVGVGWLYPEGKFDAGMDFKFQILSFDNGESQWFSSIEFGEVNMLDDTIVGEITNPTGVSMKQVNVIGICFDGDANIIAVAWEYMEETFAPGDPVSFSVDFGFISPVGCESYLVGGSGL